MQIKITNANQTTVQPFKGVNLEIGRSNTTEYISKLRRLSKPWQRQIDAGELPVAKDIEITCESLAGTVLVGWEPFQAYDEVTQKDVTIEYSIPNAKNLLLNDPDCRKFVMDVARSSDLFERQLEDEVAGK